MSTNTTTKIGYNGGTFTSGEIPTVGAFWAKNPVNSPMVTGSGGKFARVSVAVQKFPCIPVLATSWFNNKTPNSVNHEYRMQ